LYNTPTACNRATADMMISSCLFKNNLEWLILQQCIIDTQESVRKILPKTKTYWLPKGLYLI
jgi:methylglyoxal synthase